MQWLSLLPRRVPRPLPTATDQFLVTNVGTTILLKACGFIEEQGAELLDIGEDRIRLRIGSPWWSCLLPNRSRILPLEVTIRFRAADAAAGMPENRYRACISVAVRPLTAVAEPEFHDSARKLIWKLRCYFIAW